VQIAMPCAATPRPNAIRLNSTWLKVNPSAAMIKAPPPSIAVIQAEFAIRRVAIGVITAAVP